MPRSNSNARGAPKERALRLGRGGLARKVGAPKDNFTLSPHPAQVAEIHKAVADWCKKRIGNGNLLKQPLVETAPLPNGRGLELSVRLRGDWQKHAASLLAGVDAATLPDGHVQASVWNDGRTEAHCFKIYRKTKAN